MAKSNNDEKVVLELTRDQALVVENACELLARLHIGQFEFITEILLDMKLRTDDYCKRRDDARDALKLAACLLFGRTMYNTPDCHQTEVFHQAWNVYATMRYVRSWHDNPKGGTGCCYDEPFPSGCEPLPKCEIVEGGLE